MPTEQDSSSATKSGIITNASGQRHIPASVRADGSVRKEIRIRPGYRPPEDVEVYKNRSAETFRNRGKGPVLGSEAVEAKVDDGAAATGKNAKRREARKRAAQAAAATAAIVNGSEDQTKEMQGNGEEVKDPELEKEKEAKKLLKKLRQARELKDKKDRGAALLPEQFQKVIRINELIRQLDSLGFTQEGEKKDETNEDS